MKNMNNMKCFDDSMRNWLIDQLEITKCLFKITGASRGDWSIQWSQIKDRYGRGAV